MTHPQSTIRKFPPRPGVSILEVLIAIGVATIGLLGVILLVPLADHQMNRGLVLERSNQTGANAFREFQVRGMNNPTKWMWTLRGNVGRLALPRDMYFPLDANGVGTLPDPSPECRWSFCLDPRFVATNGATITTGGNPRFFPYTDLSGTAATDIRMPRITLESGAGGAMTSQHADLVFIAENDLDFQRPEGDRTLPPVQVDNAGTAWDPTATPAAPFDDLRRKADGRLSWMATLVPQEGPDLNSDTYVLSVVVFYQRDSSFTMGSTNEVENERVVQILHNPPTYTGFIAGGVGGGDVALMPRTTGLSVDAAEQELAIKGGDWVMLSRRRQVSATAQLPTAHRWYRVLAADSGLYDSDNVAGAPSNSWIRYVTLDGPDWSPADPHQRSTFTQVTIVSNVVAVFEKTVRLETSSLWSN